MERFEFLPCLYRDAQGRIQEVPYPKKEPSRDELVADLVAASYAVAKGLLVPPRLRNLEIVIFNTPNGRPDPPLVDEAKERLLRTIREREGASLIEAAGGEAVLRTQITVTTWFADRPRR